LHTLAGHQASTIGCGSCAFRALLRQPEPADPRPVRGAGHAGVGPVRRGGSGIVGELLGGIDPGPVVAIDPGLGDAHQGGRTVAAVCFADGRKVIYKPRPMTAHLMFRRLADWLNGLVPGAGLRVPAVVPRAGYGWLESIDGAGAPAYDMFLMDSWLAVADRL